MTAKRKVVHLPKMVHIHQSNLSKRHSGQRCLYRRQSKGKRTGSLCLPFQYNNEFLNWLANPSLLSFLLSFLSPRPLSLSLSSLPHYLSPPLSSLSLSSLLSSIISPYCNDNRVGSMIGQNKVSGQKDTTSEPLTLELNRREE